MGRMFAGSTRFPYRWDLAYPARVGVMPRTGGVTDVRWFDVEPCYVFHPLNACDDGDRVVVDVVRHPKMFDTHRLGRDECADARPVDGRPRRRQGRRGASR